MVGGWDGMGFGQIKLLKKYFVGGSLWIGGNDE
jgi:hypothetical protein